MVMEKQYIIKSFDDLIEFIETQDASSKDIQEIISKTIGVYTFLKPHFNKTALLQDLKSYWSEFKNRSLTDRPLFLTDMI